MRLSVAACGLAVGSVVACSVATVPEAAGEKDSIAQDASTLSSGWVPEGTTQLPTSGAGVDPEEDAGVDTSSVSPTEADATSDASSEMGPDPSHDAGSADSGVLVTQPGALANFPFGSVVGDEYALSFSYSCETSSWDSIHSVSQLSTCGTRQCERTSEQGQCGATLTRVSATEVRLTIDAASCADSATMTHCETADTLDPQVGGNLRVCRSTGTDCLGGGAHGTTSTILTSGLSTAFSGLYGVADSTKATSKTLNFPGLRSGDIFGPSSNGCTTFYDKSQYVTGTSFRSGLFVDKPGAVSLRISYDPSTPASAYRKLFSNAVTSGRVATCDFSLK